MILRLSPYPLMGRRSGGAGCSRLAWSVLVGVAALRTQPRSTSWRVLGRHADITLAQQDTRTTTSRQDRRHLWNAVVSPTASAAGERLPGTDIRWWPQQDPEVTVDRGIPIGCGEQRTGGRRFDETLPPASPHYCHTNIPPSIRLSRFGGSRSACLPELGPDLSSISQRAQRPCGRSTSRLPGSVSI